MTRGGAANDKNPLLFADPATGKYFDFVSNDEPGVGHFDQAISTTDSLFLADISSTGDMFNGAGQGVIYQIKALKVAPTGPADSGFESPSVGPVGGYFSFKYDPAGSPWTFTGYAGHLRQRERLHLLQPGRAGGDAGRVLSDQRLRLAGRLGPAGRVVPGHLRRRRSGQQQQPRHRARTSRSWSTARSSGRSTRRAPPMRRTRPPRSRSSAGPTRSRSRA